MFFLVSTFSRAAPMSFIDRPHMSNPTLNQSFCHGHVRRLSEKFEHLGEMMTVESNERLQPVASCHPFTPFDEARSSVSRRSPMHAASLNSNTNADRSRHALNDDSETRSVSAVQKVRDFLSDKETIQVLKQILVGSSVGALTGSLLGQPSQFSRSGLLMSNSLVSSGRSGKLLGLLLTTAFTGEHLANFAQWTSLNLGDDQLRCLGRDVLFLL